MLSAALQVSVPAVLHYYLPPYGHAVVRRQRALQVGVSVALHYYVLPYGDAYGLLYYTSARTGTCSLKASFQRR